MLEKLIEKRHDLLTNSITMREHLETKHIIKTISFVILLLSLCHTSIYAQVEVKASIDSVAIFIGQQTDLKLTVSAPSNANIILPTIGQGNYITPGVEVVEEQRPDTVKKDNSLNLSKKFTLTSFDENVYVIPALKVKVNGKDYSTQKIALKVVTLDVDTLHPENFYPPKSVQNNPFSWSEWIIEVWCMIGILLMIVALFWLHKRLKENKPIISVRRFIKRVPAHQRAIQAIEKLKEEHIEMSGDQKTYYTRLTDTLRQYMQERFGFSAMEMTSSEIIAMLQEKADNKTAEELHELFITADLVKFAKHTALLGENDANLLSALTFIDKTKVGTEQPTEIEITPELSENEKTTNMRHRRIKILISVITILLIITLVYAIYWLWEITM